ncbi:PLP-dependent transferase [Hortaea werneckii]|nr:PLP-dependent transferase [Hortaea werneckii]KAI6999053.1 PLP-dependent transferase [Hortaea werneckii]KAI7143613.1 PLP-dependent transferase [Hortaea werneckii]KAI7178685.1 PLP-dependent transferase [Hortaea werneckii]
MQHGRKHLSTVPQAPEDLMFGLSAAYRNDTFPHKVDLGVGAYRDQAGRPWVLPSLRDADRRLRDDPDLDHEYQPIDGTLDYLAASQRLVFGNHSKEIKSKHIASLQTLSGTGALHLGFLFLQRFLPDQPSKQVFVSTPPYANYLPILRHLSLSTGSYPYYDVHSKSLDVEGLLSWINTATMGCVILLQAGGHNPTGVDPSPVQWKKIAEAMKARHQIPFFDSAYQGFATGDLDDDAYAIRLFVQQGFDVVMVAQSYAKNMGLYGERAGCLHVVASDSNHAERISSQLKSLQRVEISTPPAYSARLVTLILQEHALFVQWQKDLQTMSGRIHQMRHRLRDLLEDNAISARWCHITEQKGMFCFSGLQPDQVKLLREKFHIYTTPDGRFSIAGLIGGNVSYVADAIKSVLPLGSNL